MNAMTHLPSPTSTDSISTATPATPDHAASKVRVWTGRVLSGVIILFLAFDAIYKLLRMPIAIEASAKLGFGADAVFAIGAILLVCTALYAIPRTATLGAVLLTGYLGGAVCTHVRSFEGAFPIAFSAAFGVLVWVSLGLRDERVRALIAPRR